MQVLYDIRYNECPSRSCESCMHDFGGVQGVGLKKNKNQVRGIDVATGQSTYDIRIS